MRERLMALGLVSFCKTTGGKGLHVVTPLAAAKKDHIGWPEAKAFVRPNQTARSPGQRRSVVARQGRTHCRIASRRGRY
jgi:DNA primase